MANTKRNNLPESRSEGAAGSSAVRLLRPLLHLVAALHFWYGIYYDCNYVFFADSPQSTQFGGKFKYLTFLDMVSGVHTVDHIACGILFKSIV